MAHDRLLSLVKKELTELHSSGLSFRAIAKGIADIPDSWYGTVSRIIGGQTVGDDKVIAIARSLELTAPPYRAYRPCIKPTSLRTVATGNEIADLLEAMNNAGVNMDYVLEALSEKLLDDAASGPVTYTPYSVYGFNEMEGI